VVKSRTMKNRHRAAQAFRMAAQSVLRAHCALGAFYRRLNGRLGSAQALVATAHTMARTVYHMLKDRVIVERKFGALPAVECIRSQVDQFFERLSA